ncbi:hypothetical protein J6TS7_26040 [Paenibacillus dendritiformis]|nr:hypothetical protein J6TS7_26040 [Paenibacillus dendritiformis]
MDWFGTDNENMIAIRENAIIQYFDSCHLKSFFMILPIIQSITALYIIVNPTNDIPKNIVCRLKINQLVSIVSMATITGWGNVMTVSCPNINSGIYTKIRKKSITQAHVTKIKRNVLFDLEGTNPKNRNDEKPIK